MPNFDLAAHQDRAEDAAYEAASFWAPVIEREPPSGASKYLAMRGYVKESNSEVYFWPGEKQGLDYPLVARAKATGI